MSNETNSTQEDRELIESDQLLVLKVHADSEPEELEALAKTIKKQVPFFTADTLLHTCSGKSSKPIPLLPKSPNSEEGTESTKSTPAQPRRGSQNRPLPDGARTLYLNIGKMKRLYAKELSELLQRERNQAGGYLQFANS